MSGRSLSIQQPWAWLIVHGHKTIENRTWSTKVRGPVLIHAGKKVDREGWHWVRERFPDIELPERFEVGGIVGRAELVDCVTEDDSLWFFGPYGFRLAGAAPLRFLPCRGRLGFFTPDVAQVIQMEHDQ